ncbi:hypothetical protein [Flavobacterium sp. SM2513]|uniref:hypothetical protein n=1 Tax=Flavobacterium sp. SM2513 TaxID=3424766 RepID=UPI003D7FD6F5
MNPFTLSCFIIVLPLISQIVLGSLSILKKVKWNFDLICLINLFAQIVFIVIALQIISIEPKNNEFRCGMGQFAMLSLGIITFIVVAIVMGIQLLIKKFQKQK